MGPLRGMKEFTELNFPERTLPDRVFQERVFQELDFPERNFPERTSSVPRRGFRVCLRILLLVSFAVVATFVICAYPLLQTEMVKVVLPEYSGEYWPSDALSVDYVPKSSEAKLALNETFLEFAAIDPSLDEDKKRAKAILEDTNGDSSGGHRFNFQFSKSDHYIDAGRNRGTRGPKVEPWLLELHSQRFGPSWPRFRQLLKEWIHKKTLEPRVMDELMTTIKKPIDDFYRGSAANQTAEDGKRYKTCAVVGNSGILLEKQYGSFIDSHDAVIRLNNAKVVGFENSVGTKTTISFVNSNVYNACGRRMKCFCHPYGTVPIVMYLCQAQHIMNIVYCQANFVSPVLVTDPRHDVLCSRLVKWYSVKQYVESTGKSIQTWANFHNFKDFHYSSGFQAVMLALGICDKVDLLGFGKSPGVRHHYHTNQKAELDLHDYEAEYLFYDDLAFNRTETIPFLSDSGIHIPPLQIYR